MKKTDLLLVPMLLLLIGTLQAQHNQWAVYAIVAQGDRETPDPCDIRYIVLQEDSLQQNLSTDGFQPIYQNLDQETATRLRNLHSPQGANLPDNVIKFSSCTMQKDQSGAKKNLFKHGIAMAKKEFKKKGVLYFVGQGAKALAGSGLVKDDTTNEILKTMGRIKVKIPIRAKAKDRQAKAIRKRA